MPNNFTFHISHITWGIIWQLIIAEVANSPLRSYIKFCNYVMLNSNESIKVTHLQKLANRSVLNGALATDKWLNNSFSESKKNFCHLIKWGTPKIYISTVSRQTSQLFRSCQCLNQISGRTKFVLNLLRNCSMGTNDWSVMHFKISLSLWR